VVQHPPPSEIGPYRRYGPRHAHSRRAARAPTLLSHLSPTLRPSRRVAVKGWMGDSPQWRWFVPSGLKRWMGARDWKSGDSFARLDGECVPLIRRLIHLLRRFRGRERHSYTPYHRWGTFLQGVVRAGANGACAASSDATAQLVVGWVGGGRWRPQSFTTRRHGRWRGVPPNRSCPTRPLRLAAILIGCYATKDFMGPQTGLGGSVKATAGRAPKAVCPASLGT